MTSPSALAHLTALGLDPAATEADVLKAHKARIRPLQKRASNAPAAMRDQAERDQAALEASTQALLTELRAARPQPAPADGTAEAGGGHYAVLGVAPTAGPEQIEAAYAQRSRKAQHTAGVGTSPQVRQDAKAELTALVQAREVLLDPAQRAAHDHELAHPTTAPAPVRPGPVAQAAPHEPAPAARPPAGPPDEPPAAMSDDDRRRRGEQRFTAGDFPGVMQLLGPLVRRSEPDPRSARLFGLAAARQGQAELALEALTLARPAVPEDPETAATLVELLSALSRRAEAVAFAEQAAREDPTDRLAVTRAVLTALAAWQQPDAAVRLADALLEPRRAHGPALECLADVLLAACEGHLTRMRDGRLVLTSANQAGKVQALVPRILALRTPPPESHVRLRRLRVQLMDARKSSQWTGGERWKPSALAPGVLVARAGTP